MADKTDSAVDQLEQLLKRGSIEFVAWHVAYMLATEVDKLREELEKIKSK